MKIFAALFSAGLVTAVSFAQSLSVPPGSYTLPAPAKWKIPAPAQTLVPENGFDKTYDFGISLPLDSTLLIQDFTQTPDGIYAARFVFESPDALSLNFFFTQLSAPAGTAFWLYNAYGELGPYTLKDTSRAGTFVSLPLGGERCTLELRSPAAGAYFRVHLKAAVYGIRADFLPAKGFGSSANCNININCPEGDNWQTEKRSAVMLLSNGGNRFCSGALINNTAENGRPYILTARHCNASESTVFMFNYESPDCSNIDGPVTQTVNGALIRAQYVPSDFTLLEMNFPPPSSYFPYYSGWDRSGTATEDHTGIHHPRGDIKKISRDTSMIQDSCYVCADPAENHWKVVKWDAGTTEGGSSGSPLYNAARHIVGQLHGGQASCSNPNGSDYYGKFSVSWEGGGTPDSRLRDWLDPANTGTLSLDGFAPSTEPVAYGLDISALIPPDSLTCADTTAVFALVSNIGFQSLDSICVQLFSDEGIWQQCKAGSWNYSEQEIFAFPGLPLPYLGTNTYTTLAWSPGTTAADTAALDVFRVQGSEMRLAIHYDLYPHEFSWEIRDENGLTAAAGNGQNQLPGAIDTIAVCLPYGCYTLVLKDLNGDGLCCNWGSGKVSLIDINDIAAGTWSNFGSETTFRFCNPYTPGLTDKDIFVFPNPASSVIQVALPENIYEQADLLLICDMNGKVLVKKETDLKYLNTFDVSNWAQGVYIVYMRAGKHKARTRFVKI